ncbi:MAG: P1 family peptidase [Kiloniellales bacterium]|nr:P1 family peptidase [Kiloniellales bacterium]
MSGPGPRNLITDVPGLTVGNAEDAALRSGATVVLAEAPAVAAADVRGGGPGTRETDLLDPAGTVQAVDALVLSGGSAFGLAAADGVMGWLRAQGRGFEIGGARVPIVPAAILFDLDNGGDKDWGPVSPYHRLGAQAVEAAGADFDLGNAGAGLGATAGPLKGGLGSASVRDGAITLGTLAAVNSLGSVTYPEDPSFWAWPFEQAAEFGGLPPPTAAPGPEALAALASPVAGNTTLAVVATDATLSRVQARRLAVMAQDGLARAIRPVHTPYDGDTVFALSTGRCALEDPEADLARLGMMAADCLARAVARAVFEAESLGGVPSYRARFAEDIAARKAAQG